MKVAIFDHFVCWGTGSGSTKGSSVRRLTDRVAETQPAVLILKKDGGRDKGVDPPHCATPTDDRVRGITASDAKTSLR